MLELVYMVGINGIMKINDIIYKTPEMSDAKLLEIMEQNKLFLTVKDWFKFSNMKEVLDEWDKIQTKSSNLSRSQRDAINGFVASCLIKMTKGNDTNSTMHLQK